MAKCALCESNIEDPVRCARLWVQATPTASTSDLAYYVHLDCCKTIYESVVPGTSSQTLHFSSASLFEPIFPTTLIKVASSITPPPPPPPKSPSPPIVIYPVQYHTDPSRPPSIHSKQCLRVL
jgi:hypothetical protein